MRILGVTDEDWKIVVLVASIIAACIGGYFLCLLGAILLKGDRDAMWFSEPGAAVAATLIATCFMFDFGAIVAPPMAITSIKAWESPWDILIIVGFLPMMIVVRYIIVDALTKRSAPIKETVEA